MSELIQKLTSFFTDSGTTTMLQQWWPQLAALLASGLALILIFRIMAGKKKRRLEERVTANTPSEETAEPASQGVFGPLTPALAAQIPESEKESRDFAKLLRQAGIYAPGAAATIYALRFALLFGMLVVTGVVVILAPSAFTWPILLAGGFLAGAMSIVPRLYVFFRRRRRVREIRNGLADMMDMLSMCMGGGLPLSPSLDHVAKNLSSHPALAQELQILKRQAEVGSLKTALADFGQRVDLPEVRQLSALLSRGDRLGTQMSASLLDQADHFRLHRRQTATLAANKTPVKLTIPLMFCFAPAALILLISPAILELTEFFAPREGQQQAGAALPTDALAFDTDRLIESAQQPDAPEAPPAFDPTAP